MKHKFPLAVVAAALMAAQSAFADGATPAPTGPLAPGQAAGIQAAERLDIGKAAIVAGIGLSAVAIYLIVGTNYKDPRHGHSTPATK